MRNPLRDQQNAEPRAHCDRCGGEVYESETMFLSEGKWLCPDCFRAEIESMLNTPLLLADALMIDYREV